MSKQEPKAHAHVVYRPMGLAEWNREKSRKRRGREIAEVTKRARR